MAYKTVQNIRDYVRKFVDLDQTDVPDVVVDAWIQEGYDDLIGQDARWPWFEVGGQSPNNYSLTLASGQQNYPMPSALDQNNMATCTVNPKRVLAVQGQHWELEYVGQTELESIYVPQFLSFTNEPSYWSIWGNQGVTIWPVPNGTYTLNVRAYRDPADFVSLGAGGIIDGPMEFGTAIQQYALAKCWQQQSDLQQASFEMSNYLASKDRIRKNRISAPLAEGLILNGGRTTAGISPRLRFPFEPGPFS